MNRKMIGAGALALALTGCGSSGTSVSAGSGTASAASDSPTSASASPGSSPSSASPSSPAATYTPAPTATNDGPVTASVGQTLQITQDGSDTADFTLTSVESSSKPRAEYGEAPKEDRFLYVTYKVTGTAGSVEVDPSDLVFRTADGDEFETYDGNAYGALERTPDTATVRQGKNARATVAFDVPKGPGEVVYSSYSGDLASWAVNVK